MLGLGGLSATLASNAAAVTARWTDAVVVDQAAENQDSKQLGTAVELHYGDQSSLVGNPIAIADPCAQPNLM